MSSMTSIKVFAVVLFIIGAALRYWVNRRRFNRNNFAGVQQYKSYEQKTVTETWERPAKWIAILLIVAGVFLYVMIKVLQSPPVSEQFKNKEPSFIQKKENN